MSNIRSIIKHWKIVCIVGAALLAGVVIGNLRSKSMGAAQKSQDSEHSHATLENTTSTSWTCSMHPQVRQPKQGKCPICFMDLIPVKTDAADDRDDQTAELTLSPRAQKLAGVETVPVERKSVQKLIKMVGVVDYDESRIAHITARMPGRVDVLYVDYTGIAVRKGDHMVGYYSPDLYVAQKELLQSAQAQKILQTSSNSDDNKFPGATTRRSVDERNILNSVIKRLKLWGLTETNIQTVLETGKVVDLVTLYAPISGIVIQKNAIEGKYFKTGDRLFTIADLSEVWIMLEAYESDLSWLHYGQKVTFTTMSHPAEKFEGTISFIDPFLDPKTRTVKLRINAANPSGKLKPDMFVNATVHAQIAQSGQAIAPDLVGKWICPMHPGIIKDQAGECDNCGMPLVTAESLGYVSAEDNQIPLVIPASAPLITGERAVVYVNDKPGHYYGQTIELGPRAGNYYVVKSGLKAGDKVVVNGNFKIDSALQIQAKPSMMGVEQPAPKTTAVSESDIVPKKYGITPLFKKELAQLYISYFAIQQALAKDDFADARVNAEKLTGLLESIHNHDMSPDALKQWRRLKQLIATAAVGIHETKDVTVGREQFEILSKSVYNLIQHFGTAGKTIFRFHCPMAFNNKGAYWLQDNPDILNSYFGDVMLKCGEQVEEISK